MCPKKLGAHSIVHTRLNPNAPSPWLCDRPGAQGKEYRGSLSFGRSEQRGRLPGAEGALS